MRDLAKNGINVVGLARRPEKVDDIAKDLGNTTGKIYSYKCDVSDRESIKKAFKWIEEQFTFVHILINNAGVGTNSSILNSDLEEPDEFDRVIKTNFNGLVHATRFAFRLMNKSEEYGMIININSVAGHSTPFPQDGKSVSNVYHGTKHAVTATTEILRQELVCMKNKKIRVSVRFDFFIFSSLINFIPFFSLLAQVS